MKQLFLGFAFLVLAFAGVPAGAQTLFSPDLPGAAGVSGVPDNIPGGHRGAVTAVSRDAEGRILSAGEDGFLGIWNGQAAVERFQLSPYGIVSMALRPGRPQVAALESDGLGLYRVSVWDYETKTNLFTLHFRDPISCLAYSAAGGFLIVARSGRTSAAFIHPETGEVLESPAELSGSIALAATGRSEKNMIVYLSSGILSYWDLDTGTERQRFEVPPNIRSPILFGNNRFLAGFDSRGLIVLDAVTGQILARDESLPNGKLSADSPESSQFNCLASSGEGPAIYRMEINPSGRFNVSGRRSAPGTAEISCAASGQGGSVILGSAQGDLWLLSGNGAWAMNAGNPARVLEAAASSSALAFIAEGGAMGYLPLNYSLLRQDDVIALEDAGDYANIVSNPSGQGESRFLLWQSGPSIPMIKTLLGPPLEAETSGFLLDRVPLRFPLRSAAALGSGILLLDTAGSVLLLDEQSGEMRFSYSATGAVDAAFIDENTIILGRSAVSGNAPFMSVNVSTGETVPLAYPGLAGVRVYRGASGEIYGAVVNQAGGTAQTSIIKLNAANPGLSERLIEYNGEDSAFALAESGGSLASTLGGGAATLYRTLGDQRIAQEMVYLERSSGLPKKLIDGDRCLIVLDGDGGIYWHDNWTGKILAVFRLYPDSWVLESNGTAISGKTARKRASPSTTPQLE